MTDSPPVLRAAVQRFLVRVQEHHCLIGKPPGSPRIVDILEFLQAQDVAE